MQRTLQVMDTKGAEINVTPGATAKLDFTADATGLAAIVAGAERAGVLATASGVDVYYKTVPRGAAAPTVSATNGHIIPQDSSVWIPVNRTQDIYIFGTAGGKLTACEYR